ncbi:NUDIX domain-containing protein [Nocardioides jiangxiensis]|uniref:NUDIX hydrolase n=1 Tax=Nocardioides jiangxiensis TaxID=3064524 RepID=A0ABT9AWE5_9ACTN|nr:NUDIX hydrolase [Nocardioides sp. WY-20]MDO7866750.1 NUDIX hydrolase [Nocardioides sp. WY-20]
MPIADRPESWPVVSTEDIHRDDWVVALRADAVRRPGDDGTGEGAPFRRLVLEHPGAAIILAVDDEGQVLCLQQYRHPARMSFVELPAGICDVPGEDPIEVAKRELREEVELAADEWVHLGSVWASPGISAERHHLYFARGLTPSSRGDFELHGEEAEMEVFRAPFEELHAAVLDGRVSDAPIALALLMARAKGLA